MKVTIVGDSFSKGYLVYNNYTRLLKKAGFTIFNISENGATSYDCLRMYEKSKISNNEILIVFVGINDFYQGQSVEFAYKNVKSILKLKEFNEKIIILPPLIEIEEVTYSPYEIINNKINEYDEKLKNLGKNYIDARKISGRYIDGLHRTEDFHRNLSDAIIKKLNEVKNGQKDIG